jgi:hypothetical protein
MKISEIKAENIADYLRLEEGTYYENNLDQLIAISKAYIKSYTGLTDEEIDTHEDFIIVVYILCQDMYDNRTLYVDKSNINHVVDTILGMHCVNLV